MRRLPILALALLVFAVSSVAFATTVVRMDLEDLVAKSDLVVVGSIAEVEPKLHDDGRVYTHVKVSVDEVLSGEETDTVSIVHIGGRVESRATVVHGMPDFTLDERVLLFLEKPESVDHFVVTGLSQGKFSLSEDDDGTVTLTPAAGDMALVKPVKMPTGDVQLQRAEPADVTGQARTLDEMRRRIAKFLNDSGDADAK